MLVHRALQVFEEGEWKLRKVMTTKVNDPHRTLGECIPAENTIRIFPKLWGEKDPPLAKTLIHELVGHMLLGYGGSDVDEKDCTWFEMEIWRHLDQDAKEKLTRMVEEENE